MVPNERSRRRLARTVRAARLIAQSWPRGGQEHLALVAANVRREAARCPRRDDAELQRLYRRAQRALEDAEDRRSA